MAVRGQNGANRTKRRRAGGRFKIISATATYFPVSLQRHIAKDHFFQFFLMHTGTVKFFNETKGFGFIVDDSTQEEFFVHVTGLVDKIREGDKVEFELTRGKKGMNAVDVKVS
jgi:CspA family cold shock protein